jgi:hypothetical protein
MTQKIFVFCLAVVASLILFANTSTADDNTSKDAKVVIQAAEVVVDEVDAPAPTCGRRHFRRFPRLRFARFDFPEIKFPRLNCCLFNQVEEEELVEEEVAVEEGKVVFERNISFAGKARNIKYVKIPGRFLLKRIVTKGEDVEP